MDDRRRALAHLPSNTSPLERAGERVIPRHDRQDPDTSSEDEAAAEEARLRYRSQVMVELEPDPTIARLLRPGEALLAIRRAVRCERRQDPSRLGGMGLCGDLYLTSARLELLGQLEIGIDLDGIDEVLVCSEQLLLMMRDGTGITLDAEWPRLLRVEIAAARAAARD
jgi:hypothetical protein